MKMKKRATKSLGVICVVICILSTLCINIAAKEPEIEPRYTGITLLATDMKISTSGVANCYGQAWGKDGYHVELTLELRRDGETIKTWNKEGVGEVEINGVYIVTPGHDYQTFLTARVTDSSGSYVEKPTTKSDVTRY